MPIEPDKRAIEDELELEDDDYAESEDEDPAETAEFLAVRDKLSAISERLQASVNEPDYATEIFPRLAAEAREVCGEKYASFLEFLGPYIPITE